MANIWCAVLCVLCVGLVVTQGSPIPPCEQSASVVIWGGTVCGATAAVAATRSDHRTTVLWLVNGTRLGGMTSGGLGGVDKQMKIGGLADELLTPLGNGFEPHVAEAAVEKLVATAGDAITIVRSTGWLGAVTTTGSSPRWIVSATTLTNRTFCGAMWIDCSYEGDLLQLSGTAHTFGREARSEFNESEAGTDSSDTNFADTTLEEGSQWFEPDVSPWLDITNKTLLPTIVQMVEPHSSAGGEADNRVMSYCFRMCLTNNASNAITITPPHGYTRGAVELLRRELLSLTHNRHFNLTMADLFLIRALPHNKIDLNSGQWTATGKGAKFPFSTDLPFAQFGWPDGDAATRASIFAAHKWWTQALLYYLGNDAELKTLQPQLVKEMATWGLCGDEYMDEPDHWTPQLYVREANRLRGAVVMTQKEICHPKQSTSAVGVSFWMPDIHSVQRVAALNTSSGNWQVYNAGGRDGFKMPRAHCPSGLVEVPYGALIPKANDTANLLCPAPASFTHVAYSTFRLEPQYAIFGHSAGAAASMALSTPSKRVQEVDVKGLRRLLLSQKQIISAHNPTLGFVTPS